MEVMAAPPRTAPHRFGRLRWTGLAGVATLWATVAAGMAITGLRPLGDRPLSYLGTVPGSTGLFRAGLLAAALLLAAFSLFTQAAFALSPWFVAVSWTGMAGQVVVALVPLDGPGAAHAVHTGAGLLLGISLPVLLWRFAVGQPPGAWRATARRLLWLEVAAVVAGLLLSGGGRAALAEVLPAGAYHLWIAVVTARSARPGLR
jgi:hypothetical protein